MSLSHHYFACALCPRRCGVNRDITAGHCGVSNAPTLARAALHHWEEPCISGTRGSGTVFFSGCSLHCLYCQNHIISQKYQGSIVTPERVRKMFQKLANAGAHNINLVTPTHFSHALEQALEPTPPIPVVWNSSGYELVETLAALEGKIQVYLPDLKYLNPETALAYSDAADYPDFSKDALKEMVRQVGPYQLDEHGVLRRGVLIRHLLLPGGLREARAVMDWVAETFSTDTVLFSLMSQYTPMGHALEEPALARCLRPSEIRSATAYMDALGLVGYQQGESAATTRYIPAFDSAGI